MTTKAASADRLAGRVTTTLGATWGAIRKRHVELPPAVLVLGSGEGEKWGHWAASSWAVGGAAAGEVLVAGELLAPGGGNYPDQPVEERVLATLLHEAGHALAYAREVRDTSQRGRYHNETFRGVAVEVGLECSRGPHHGWHMTKLQERTRLVYAPALKELASVLEGYRRPFGLLGAAGPGVAASRTTRWVRGVCPCGRVLRASRTAFEAGPIVCSLCARPFKPDAA